MLQKKCNFTLCINKIDEGTICECQYAFVLIKIQSVQFVNFVNLKINIKNILEDETSKNNINL